MFVPLGLLLGGCATPPSAPSGQRLDCQSGTVQANVGGEAVIGVGSDGFISDTDLVFSTVVTPGASPNCTTVGATVPVRQGQSF